LIYTPAQLAVKPKYDGEVEIKIGEMGATHSSKPNKELVDNKIIEDSKEQKELTEKKEQK